MLKTIFIFTDHGNQLGQLFLKINMSFNSVEKIWRGGTIYLSQGPPKTLRPALCVNVKPAGAGKENGPRFQN